jgi:hypothetical protein
MKYTVVDALSILRPGAHYIVRGDVYSGIEWLDSGQTKPTEKEINDKISELDSPEPMRLLREERTNRLKECDWTQFPDVPDATRTAWQTYRQQLRDLPASASPKLDEFYKLDLTSVTWPTEPS